MKSSAHRFCDWHAHRWWPGCTSAWYNAHCDDSLWGERCIPGRTQYVVYRGGLRQDQESAPEPAKGYAARSGLSSAGTARGGDRRRG